MTNTELETAYLTLCKRVKADAMNIMGMAGVGRSEDAAIAALTLADYASTAAHQYKMRQEQAADSYDLAALRMDVTDASNSETGFEDKG